MALTLLLAGRISDAFGRTPVTSLTLMLAIVGCIMFMMADSGAAVLAARFVQGLSAGFGMSAVSALVIDCVGEKHPSAVHRCQLRRHGGHHDRSVAVGILYDVAEHRRALRHHDRHPGRVPVPHARGARAPRPDALAARRQVRVYIPADNRRLFAVVAVCYLATWLVSCFYQSFSAPIAQQCFGETSPLAGSVILAPSWRRRSLAARSCSASSPSAPSSSMAAVTVTTALMALFVLMGAELLFMGDCALFSFAMGVAVSVSLRLLLLRVSVLRVSAILASVNLVAYAGSAITGVICGILLEATSFAFVFAAMAAVPAAASLLWRSLRRPARRRRTAASRCPVSGR